MTLLLDAVFERRKFVPTSLTSVTLKAWYDASQETGADGTSLGTISDHSGNGKTLSQATGSLQPTIQTDSDGRRYYSFDGVDDNVKAATAADWSFLNTGAHTVFVVVECYAHAGSNIDTVFDTGGQSSANTGLFFAFDNRGSPQAGPNGIQADAAKGTSGTFAYQILSTLDSAPSGQRHIFALIAHGGTTAPILRINGDRGEKVTAGATSMGGSTPLSALCVGLDARSLSPGHVRIHEMIFCSGEISTAEREQVLGYLARKWGGVTWSDKGSAVTVENTTTYDAFPSMAPASNGDLIIVARRGSAHISNFGDIIQWRSTDGGATWGASSVIFDGTTENADLRDPGITRLLNGTLLLTCHVYAIGGTGTSSPQNCRWATSTNGGATWSSLNTLNDAFVGFSRCSTRVLELDNGDLLWAIYGNDTSDSTLTNWYVKVYKSTNGGATWSFLANIGSSSDGKQWSETTLIQSQTTGDIIALCREDSGVGTTHALARAVSTDNGATWTAFAVVQANVNSSPQACWTARGTLVIAQRQGEPGSSDKGVLGSGYIYTSLDDGASWTKGEIIFSSGGGSIDFEYGAPLMLSRSVLIAYARESSSSDSDVLFTSFAEI